MRKKQISSKRNAWQLQEAKARFSELFRLVRAKGPQWVTRQGKEAVVLLPAERYDELTRKESEPLSLVEFFAASPLAQLGASLERDRDIGRNIEL